MPAQETLVIDTRGVSNGATYDTLSFDPIYASVPDKAKGKLVLESKWTNTLAPSGLGALALVVQSQPADGKGMQLVKLRHSIPTLEAPASGGVYVPVPKVAYTCEAEIKFFLPSRATNSEKYELLSQIISLVSQEFLFDIVTTNAQIS